MDARTAPALLACAAGLLIFACERGAPGPAPESVRAAPAEPGHEPEPAPRRSFRFTRHPAAPTSRPAGAPMSLTASDGTGLKLRRLVGRAVVQEPLAFTELRLTFDNPEARVIEGQFRITLPQGATISRFAMKQDQRWQEGEVVERQAARRAYEDFLHRRQDPALLEQSAGNEFSARVFPIPARGRKELIVSYSQELAGRANEYVLPLRGLPELGEVDVAVYSGGGASPAQELKQTGFVPDQDFRFPVRRVAGRAGVRSENLIVARVSPMPGSRPDEIDSVAILVDSSASRALGFGEQIQLLEGLTQGLRAANPGLPLTVASFDQAVEPIYQGPAEGFGDAQLQKIRERRALGASDLERALRWAQGQAAPAKRLLLITDGVPTAGAVEGDALIAAVRALKPAGIERVDAIAVGGIRDEALLHRLVTAGLARDGVVVDGLLPLEEIGRRLTATTRSGLEVKVDGASWWWPRKLAGIQAGDEVLVYADVPPGTSVKLSIGGEPAKLGELAATERPLLERAWTQARIASLLERRDTENEGPKRKREIEKEIVSLSIAHRVLSPYTALLVLETPEDYARFGINRNALTDILVVDDRGQLALTRRSQIVTANVRARPRPAEKSLEAPGERAADGARADQEVAAASAALAKPEVLAEPLHGSAGASRSASEESLEDVFAPAVRAPPSVPRQAQSMAGVPVREEGRESTAGRAGSGASSASPLPVPQAIANPYAGRFKKVMNALKKKDLTGALTLAAGWREEDPGDVMALIALGEVLEAQGDDAQAARAYGSIIDLFAARADLRRFAGERLEHLKGNLGLELAVDAFSKAAMQRPDHPSSHRLLAYALLKKEEHAKAFDAILKGLNQEYPEGRFAGVRQILTEDLGLIGAAWIKIEPGRRKEILKQLKKQDSALENEPSLRFVLNWETDANDVDFHIYDGQGGHAFFQDPNLGSGGSLYADVTTGYGPECFTIRLPKKQRAYPYTLQAHYYSRGPMGYGMGKMEIIEHDGKGGLTFDERMFVVMVDEAFVEMGKVRR